MEQESGSRQTDPSAQAAGYYFENELELRLYQSFCDRDAIWLAGPDYTNACRQGDLYFQQQQYQQAAAAYLEGLRLNPIGLRARFDLCEAFIKLHDLATARQILLDMKDYLVQSSTIAHFYQRMGRIEVELNNTRCAAACYRYSQRFDDSDLPKQVLQRMAELWGSDVVTGDPVPILAESNIPIFEQKQSQPADTPTAKSGKRVSVRTILSYLPISIFGFIIIIGCIMALLEGNPDRGLTKVDAPRSGYVFFNRYDERPCVFEVENCDFNAYYMKFVDLDTDLDVIIFFIRPNCTTRIQMPIGNYELRYATGGTWYGQEYLFGANTVYAKGENPFPFEETDEYVTIWYISLYTAEDDPEMDTLYTQDISAQDF